ncbi:hypothetical protein AAHC03_02018 [Spirometra sp. Aus1]
MPKSSKLPTVTMENSGQSSEESSCLFGILDTCRRQPLSATREETTCVAEVAVSRRPLVAFISAQFQKPDNSSVCSVCRPLVSWILQDSVTPACTTYIYSRLKEVSRSASSVK